MGGLFNYDSSIMRFLGRMADLMLLNVIALICCIPIVTIGAVLTAMHYVCLRMKRNVEGHIVRNFLKSFRENFKQSTIIWLILLAMALFLGFDLYITSNITSTLGQILQVVITTAVVLTLFVYMWVFALQAKFVNSVSRTIKNALIISCVHFFRTIYMIILGLLPILLVMVSVRVVPVVLLLGISLPVYLSVTTYNKVFEKLEETVTQQ